MPRSVSATRSRALTTPHRGSPGMPTLGGYLAATASGVVRTNPPVAGSCTASVRMAALLLPSPTSVISAAPTARPDASSATSSADAPKSSAAPVAMHWCRNMT